MTRTVVCPVQEGTAALSSAFDRFASGTWAGPFCPQVEKLVGALVGESPAAPGERRAGRRVCGGKWWEVELHSCVYVVRGENTWTMGGGWRSEAVQPPPLTWSWGSNPSSGSGSKHLSS